MSAFDVLLGVHVVSGSVALVSGPVPMLARKGRRLHRRSGDVYAAAMLATAASAFALAAVTGNELLLMIAVFTTFLLFNGVRAILFRRGRRAPSWVDDAVCVLTAGFSVWLLWQSAGSGDVTRVAFGLGGCVLTARQWRLLRNPRTDWLVAHLSGMGAAYIATVSAFLVVNLQFVPQYIPFIGPTLIGTPLIAWAASRHGRPARPAG